MLYDRVAKIAALDTLSDVITSNTNPAIKSSSIHFLQAWQELYDASYNPSSMLKPQSMDALVTQSRMDNMVPLGILNYQFNVFDSNAIQHNWL